MYTKLVYGYKQKGCSSGPFVFGLYVLIEKATQVTAMIYCLKTRDRENWGENKPEPLREIF